MAEALKAAIWTRVSTDAQEDGTSPETQLAESQALCAVNRWDVVRTWRVTFTAEWAEDIPDWQELMAAIRRREFDVLVALSYDRLARHHFDIGTTLRACQRHGVKVAFVEDDVPEGEYGDLFVFMKGFAAYGWRKGIIEAAGRGQRAKMHGDPENGKPPRLLGSQRPPYGLRWVEEYETRRGIQVPAKQRFEPNPDTIDALRLIFRWYDEGMSLRELAKRLTAQGISPPGYKRTGNPQWSPSTLRGILKNPNYVGIGFVGVTDRRKLPGQGARYVEKPREEWVRLPEGTFPQVIDEALFARVQDRLEQQKRDCPPGNRNPKAGLLRRGLVLCGCGRPLHVLATRGHDCYRVDGRHRDRYGCAPLSMRTELLDQQVWDFVTRVMLTPGALEAKLFAPPAPDPTHEARPAVAATISRLTRERDRTLRRLRATDDDDLAAAYEDDLKAVQAELRVAEAERLKLVAQHDAWQAGQERRSGVLDYVNDVRSQLDGLDWHGKRNLLRRIGATVTLHRDQGTGCRWSLTTRWRPASSLRTQLNCCGDIDMRPAPEGTVYVDLAHAKPPTLPDGWWRDVDRRDCRACGEDSGTGGGLAMPTNGANVFTPPKARPSTL